MVLGSDIYLSLGGAASSSGVIVVGILCAVVGETENAVRVRAYRRDGTPAAGECWFPRKALQLQRDDGRYGKAYTLARWFRPGEYAARWLARNS